MTELEEYRRHAISILSFEGSDIAGLVEGVLKLPVRGVYIIGSVLEHKRFTESSDIDVAIVVTGAVAPAGSNETLSMKVQAKMYPLGDLGIVNTLVFVDKLVVKRGKTKKIW